MLSHSRLVIEWEIAPLRLLLEEVVPHVSGLVREREVPGELGILADRRLSPAATTSAAATLVVVGVMHQLAALVETCLHHLAGRFDAEGQSFLLTERSPSWHSSLKTVERECTTRASLFPGWQEVQTLRAEMNASKHQGGFLFVGDPLPHVRTVATTLGDPERKLDEVEAWLVSITDVVDLHLASTRVNGRNDR